MEKRYGTKFKNKRVMDSPQEYLETETTVDFQLRYVNLTNFGVITFKTEGSTHA